MLLQFVAKIEPKSSQSKKPKFGHDEDDNVIIEHARTAEIIKTMFEG